MTVPGSWVGSRPTTDPALATTILERWWGIAGALEPLSSERDQNLLVHPSDGQPALVLKIANLAEDPALLACQELAMARLASAGVPVARSVPALDGRTIVDTGDPGPPWVRVMTWLPGRPLADVAEPTDALLGDLGSTMGRCAAALSAMRHPAATRELQWDVLRAPPVIAERLADIADRGRRALLTRTLAALETRLAPAFPALRRSIIHNDANDHNVLVDAEGARVVGLLDFGDMVETVTAHEAAVAATYAMFHRSDPVTVIAPLLGTFDRACPLADAELDAFPDLVLARVATSLAISARQGALDPDPYLRISEGPGWELLETLDRIGIDDLRAATRAAVAR